MSNPFIDARTASAIAAAMMAVALADGEAHEAELALVGLFRAELPDGVDPSGVVLTDPAVREVLVRSMLAVALADGAVGPEERDVIQEIARAHGVGSELVAALEARVCREMLQHFHGVRDPRARAQAERIGQDLGLSAAEVAGVLDEPADG